MRPKVPRVKIVNIVATAKVKSPFDLNLIAKRIDGTESSPKSHWLKFWIQPENYYVAFYRSGKFLIAGVKDLGLIDDVVKRVLDRLTQAGIEARLESVTVHNIVLMDEIELSTSLENLVTVLGYVGVSYEPEQFPGLLYKDEDGISYILFSTGKMIITGLTDIDLAQRNIQRFKALVTT
jgi:transcription initiation factor TFIID TATA-box-binding protein